MYQYQIQVYDLPNLDQVANLPATEESPYYAAYQVAQKFPSEGKRLYRVSEAGTRKVLDVFKAHNGQVGRL